MCDIIPDLTKVHLYAVTTFESRLKAKVCEICGTTESQCYEIHHINKLKTLKGKELWERVMLAKRRKTIVVCHECHLKIHNRSSKTSPIAETM
jgi:Fe-S-cluster-containing hydrogenase component 2